MLLFIIHNGVNWVLMMAGKTVARKLGCLSQRKELKWDMMQDLHGEDSRLKVTGGGTELQETQGDDERNDNVNKQAGIDVVR